jgi:PAS domain S-box-containing protein
MVNLAAVLPALLISVYLSLSLREQEILRSESHILSQARILRNQHERQLEETRRMLDGMADAVVPALLQAGRCDDALKQMRFVRPSYLHSLFITGADGSVLCSDTEASQGTGLASQSPAQPAMVEVAGDLRDRLRIGHLAHNAVLMSTQVPVRAMDKPLRLGATLDLSWLRNHPQLLELPEGAAYTLIGSQGEVLLSQPEGGLLTGENIAQSPMWRRLQQVNAPVTFAQSGRNGQVFQVAHVVLGRAEAPDAHLLVSVPIDAVTAHARRVLHASLASLALASGLCLLLGWTAASALILRPMRPVFSTLRRLAGGDFSARTGIAPGASGELGRLAVEVDDMAKALSDADCDRQRVQEALRRECERAQAYLDVVGVMVIVLDAAGRVSLANRKACEALQYPAATDFVGVDLFARHFAPGQRRDAENAFRRLMAGESVAGEHVENEILTCTGQHRAILWHNAVLPDSQGQPVSAVYAGEDITERKTAEEQLRAARQTLQQVTDTIPHRVFWKDRESRFLGCNASFARDAGLSGVAEIVGKTDHDLPWRTEAARYRVDDWEVMRTGAPKLNYEELQTASDGEQIWLETNKVPLRSPEGEIIGVLGLYRDISARKRLEQEREKLHEQLQQAQKMEALGQFTGGIAHDFNNILGCILGFARLALRRHEAAEDTTLAQYLGEVVTAGERARALVVNMLAFSRSQPDPNRAPHHPGSLLEEAMKLLGTSIPASILVTKKIEEKLPAICIDPVELQQIVLNLALNARDAMHGMGRLFVGLRRSSHHGAVCTITHQRIEGDFVELTVSDSGTGIPPEVLARIFEPFFTTKEVGQGSGMGLAVVHGLVKRASGHILVEPWEGEGTTFRILFPVADTPVAELAAEPVVRPALRGCGRVLVVEDDRAILRLLRTLLEDAGYRVEAHTNPLQALAAFRAESGSFTAAVLDQMMPHLTGMELLGSLRQLRLELPVILCTEYSDCVDEGMAAVAGVQRFFRKPVDADDLLGALAEITALPPHAVV